MCLGTALLPIIPVLCVVAVDEVGGEPMGDTNEGPLCIGECLKGIPPPVMRWGRIIVDIVEEGTSGVLSAPTVPVGATVVIGVDDPLEGRFPTCLEMVC